MTIIEKASDMNRTIAKTVHSATCYQTKLLVDILGALYAKTYDTPQYPESIKWTVPEKIKFENMTCYAYILM